LVFIFLKPVQTKNYFKKKPKPNQNRFKPTGFGSVFRTKTDLAWFFRFVSGLAWFFPGFFGLGSVRFFRFQAYKTETKPVGFFKILIGFFHGSIFSINFLYFLNFSIFQFLIGSDLIQKCLILFFSFLEKLNT